MAIGMVIERQLNGKVEQDFGPEGLDVRLIVPITHERWPAVSPPVAEGKSKPDDK